MKRTVAVVGPVPPPYGGVSVHVARALDLLAKAGHRTLVFRCSGLDGRGTSRFFRAVGMLLRIWTGLPRSGADVVHFHYAGMGWLLAAAPALAAGRRRRVATFHSVRIVRDLAKLPGPLRRSARRLLGRFDAYVCVRGEIGDALESTGLDASRVAVVPAFLPPAPAEAAPDRLPADLADALMNAPAEGPDAPLRLACAAYYLGPGYGEDDLYGVELLARTLATLDSRLERPVVLHVMVSNAPTGGAAAAAAERVRAAVAGRRRVKIDLRFGVPLVPVLARCRAFLRPSREDGDSVAVRESLALGVPVWASDVVKRPEGVTLFRLGGDAEIAASLADFLASLTGTAPRAAAGPDLGARLLEVLLG